MKKHLKTGLLVWGALKGPCLTKEEKRWIETENISTLVLFKRNILSLKQILELCREIKSLKPSPLIAIDREGGAVDRLSHLKEFPSWPGPKALAGVCTSKEIQKTSFFLGRELYSLGIDINLAPCLDIQSTSSPLLEKRVFGHTPKRVTNLAKAFLEGLSKAGLSGLTVKHFPGHGGVREDSHKELPIDGRAFKEINKTDLIPFKTLFSQMSIPITMSAHVLYPALDKKYPATLSYSILTRLLKKTLGYRGCVLSDDLDMLALRKFYPLKNLVLVALNAGVDLLMTCGAKSWQQHLPEWIREGLDKKLVSPGALNNKIKKARDLYLSLKEKSPPAPYFNQWTKTTKFLNQHFAWCDRLDELLKNKSK